MRPGHRKLVQAQRTFRDAVPVPTFEPATVVSVGPLVVSWRGSPLPMPYLSGLVLSPGQSVLVVFPPTGTPFVLGALTGP